MEYRPASEVAEIAAELIATVEQHQELDACRIVYVFLNKTPTRHGKDVAGRARKINGLSAWLAQRGTPPEVFEEGPEFFVIEIALPIWLTLDDFRRRALVDHELCHCRAVWDENGELQLTTVGHDFEEFRSVVDRYGLWNDGAVAMGAVIAEQLALNLGDVEDFLRRGDGDSTEGGGS